jgi:hypothetical protein
MVGGMQETLAKGPGEKPASEGELKEGDVR